MESLQEIPTTPGFKEFTREADFQHPPLANLQYRKRTVLLVCRDQDRKFILGGKAGYYPAGISRLPGGGIDEGESVIDAARREGHEELRIDAGPDAYRPLAVIKATGRWQGKTYRMNTYVYYVDARQTGLTAGDDVTDVLHFDEAAFRRLIAAYHQLPIESLYQGSEGTFSWGEFGRFYGFVHQVALDEALAMTP